MYRLFSRLGFFSKLATKGFPSAGTLNKLTTCFEQVETIATRPGDRGGEGARAIRSFSNSAAIQPVRSVAIDYARSFMKTAAHLLRFEHVDINGIFGASSKVANRFDR